MNKEREYIYIIQIKIAKVRDCSWRKKENKYTLYKSKLQPFFYIWLPVSNNPDW